jgi:phospholipase D1/2
MAEQDASKDGDHHSLSDKLKHPFHELKEKLHHTHLHDAKGDSHPQDAKHHGHLHDVKVALHHQK